MRWNPWRWLTVDLELRRCSVRCRGYLGIVALAIAGCFAADAAGQSVASSSLRSATTAEEWGRLPDAPNPAGPSGRIAAASGVGTQATGVRMASRYDKIVEPGEMAPHLEGADKVLLGMRASVSFFTAVGWLASAGYEQATDGSPNYGHQGKAFAQRLGASAARAASEDVFADSVLATVLHEDPRYYVLGTGHSAAARGLYAVSKLFVTRTDGGRNTLNVSVLGGNLAGAAMTQAYYPPLNRGFVPVAKTYGGSLGGSALGFVLSEFFTSVTERLGLKELH